MLINSFLLARFIKCYVQQIFNVNLVIYQIICKKR